MSDTAPLFLSAIELLAHAIELYGDDRKRKFVVLHVANAIELLLKDLMVDEGISIYEPRRGITVNIWAAFDSLEERGIAFPERPVIELLVDDRNAIQHRFGSPDAKTVSYYLERALAFCSRILRDHYGEIELADLLRLHLGPEDLESVGLAPAPDSQPDPAQVFDQSREWAFLHAFGSVETLLQRFLRPSKAGGGGVLRHPLLPTLVAELESAGYAPPNAAHRITELVDLRNRVAHATPTGTPTRADFDFLVSLAKSLERAIIEGFIEDREKERLSAGQSD